MANAELVPGLGEAFDTICEAQRHYDAGDFDTARSLELLTAEALSVRGLSVREVGRAFIAAHEERKRMQFDLHFETQMERGKR